MNYQSLTFAIIYVTAVFTSVSAQAQDFQITGIRIDASGFPRVQFISDTNSYYTLFRGRMVTNITTPVDMVFGASSGDGTLIDRTATNAPERAFYVIRRLSLSAPSDTDGDRIDDIYELLHPSILSPVYPVDAHFDPDNNGLSNLVEYRKLFGYDASILQVFSHEESVFNFGLPGSAHEAVSTEVSIYNANPGSGPPKTAVAQVYSRETGVFNFGFPSARLEGISHEATVFNLGSPPVRIEAIAHEISVYNANPGSSPNKTDIAQAFSREMTVFNFSQPIARLEAISRELTVLNFQEPN